MTDTQTDVAEEIPVDVRRLMTQMCGDAVIRGGCLIIEEGTWEQFVNAELETARIQDGLVEPDVEQVLDDLAHEGDREYDKALFQRYLNESCGNCGGPCEPNTCQVLTENDWSVNYG